MDIEKLMEDLRNLKYSTELMGRKEQFPVIDRNHLCDVEMVIRQHLLDEHDKEIGVLKAKVYAYERIIANSNFAPMVIKESENKVCKGCHYDDGEAHAECVVCDKVESEVIE